MENLDKNLFIRVIDFALAKYPDGFNYSDIVESKELHLNSWEQNAIDRHFLIACAHFSTADITKGETIFTFIHGDHLSHKNPENKFTLSFGAQFTFIDYQELKFARENAREARSFSSQAIRLSILAIIISVAVPLLIACLMTQNVKFDTDQLQELKEEFQLYLETFK